MAKIQYKTVNINTNSILEDILNKHSNDGWTLVQIYNSVVIFSKKITNRRIIKKNEVLK